MIYLVAWLIVGSAVGWLASLMVSGDARQDRLFNIAVGVVGAALAGWLISPVFGVPTINQGGFSLGAFFVSLIGAVFFLAIINLVGRDILRSHTAPMPQHLPYASFSDGPSPEPLERSC
jgi:uncharacterized membrane protein YeaQ/YmgE (transglycosylase-associated protein family)